MLKTKIRPSYEFGPFRLDPTERQLVREGQPLQLTPKVFDTLVALVERRRRLVEKDELMQLVWADGFVEEANLARAVHTLRKALGEEHNEHKYIETVPKRGYRFVAEVREIEDGGGTGAWAAAGARGVVEGGRDTRGENGKAEGLQDATETANHLATTPPIPLALSRVTRSLAIFIAMSAFLIAAAIIGYFYSGQGRQAVTDNTPINSIAVMPFVNAGADPEVEYLSDGLSESLINSLSQLPQLKVIPRSSSFKYKGKEVDPQEAARSLGVEAILTGRVLRHGDNLSISVELVDARDNTHMWGEQYNRKESDLVVVQAEISREIAESLRLRLTAGELQQLAKRETVNPQAYELVLKGRFYMYKPRKDEQKKAVEYYQQAIVLDPDYALAYVELSAYYLSRVYGGSIHRPEEEIPKAEAAARRALELDGNLAEAHGAMARVKVFTWDWATAEREYTSAIELNPNLSSAHSGYSRYLSVVGRHNEAIAEAKRARELDPVRVSVCGPLYSARRYDEAIEALKNMLEMHENFSLPYSFLGLTYLAKGMYAEAIAAYQQAIKIGGDNTSDQVFLGAAYAKAGERTKAQAILKRLERTKEYVSPSELAVLYAALDEREKAFASLERAYSARDYQLQYLGSPEFDSLRSDPRFQALLRRVGLAA